MEEYPRILEGMIINTFTFYASKISSLHHFWLFISFFFQELHARKQENMQIENTRESDNDLLKYLRSLDPDMVTTLMFIIAIVIIRS